MKPIVSGIVCLLALAPISLAQGPAVPPQGMPNTLPAPGQPVLVPMPMPVPEAMPTLDSGEPIDLFAPPPPPGPRFWGEADYLRWWIRKGPTPPLVVTGSAQDTFPGALDQPGTLVLYGANGVDYQAFSGGRFTAGLWLDPESRFGISGSGFVLKSHLVSYSASGGSNGMPFLAIPYVNAATGNENVYFVSQNFANPNLNASVTGGVTVNSSSQLWSWELNGVANLFRSSAWMVDALLGYRMLQLNESLSDTTTAMNIVPGGAVTFLGTTVDPPYTVSHFDTFATRNMFNGAQASGRIQYFHGRMKFELLGKLAVGYMYETVTINGGTSTTAPLPQTTAIGGIFAQGTNIGRYTQNVSTVIPEIDFNVSLALTKCLWARIGYTFLYVSDVARPGAQIDRVINRGLVPIDQDFGTPGGPARPAFQFTQTAFWAQGINFGFEYRF